MQSLFVIPVITFISYEYIVTFATGLILTLTNKCESVFDFVLLSRKNAKFLYRDSLRVRHGAVTHLCTVFSLIAMLV